MKKNILLARSQFTTFPIKSFYWIRTYPSQKFSENITWNFFLSEGMGCMSSNKNRGTVGINEAHTFSKDWNNVQIPNFDWSDCFLVKHLLTHFIPVVPFYTPWKHQKPVISWCFKGYRKRPMSWNKSQIVSLEKVL